MDKAGGKEAEEAQKQVAAAAGMFLTSTSNAFEMYAEFEYLTSGAQKPDKKITSMENAIFLCRESVDQLGTAKRAFDILREPKYAEAISLINIAIDKKLKEPSYRDKIFMDASVYPTSRPARRVLKAYETAKTIGVINIAISEIENVNSAMQAILKELKRERIPETKMLWQSSARWNTALYTGRVIAALFKVQE